MNLFSTLFLNHPQSVDEGYFEHLAVASWFALKMLFGGMACLVHALLPCLFVETGSKQINDLYQKMVLSRHRKQSPKTAT